ncbi:MAG: HAD family phosphatase [Oscillospiraceae bacterium]|nr:HAD family phosphatase [Oscillospiraceae bacterium]
MMKLSKSINFPNLGVVNPDSGFLTLGKTSDGLYETGKAGVLDIAATGDNKVEFIAFEKNTLACVKSSVSYPAYYPVYPVKLERPVKAVLMDLDGTTVRSEDFWVWIIQMSVASLLKNNRFEFEESDMPFVSGHSVSEHLQYCIDKYCPGKSLEEARNYYFEHTHREMEEIMQGRGKDGAFTPTEGVKDFLLELKSTGIKIGLVTSGLYEKAYPEIISAFKTLNMGDPKEFYDAIISAGFPLRKGSVGTLGELSPKPHPWLYSETCIVGLGIGFNERNCVLGIEDSGAGVCSVRLAGYTTVGITGGNIIESGTKALCDYFEDSFTDIMKIIKG